MNTLFVFVLVPQLIVLSSAESMPRPECGENEIFMHSGPPCPQNCVVNPRECLPEGKFNVSGCYCMDGYVRYDGQCRESKQVCCPHFEIYKCGSPCQNECSKLGEICPILNKKCVYECFCIDGYARDENGRCILESECKPVVKCKDPNEHYEVECGKCVCNAGFVRDRKGRCVKLHVKCKNRNEHYEVECGKCVCNAGYVRNKDGICIKIPVRCRDPNEHYEPECEKCVCNSGFIRNKKGICVKISPPPVCKYANEIYEEECGLCVCQEGYSRDKKGYCIKISECSAPVDGKHVCKQRNQCYQMCGNPGQGTCANPDRPLYCKMACHPGCFCKEGYLLNEHNGQCVKPAECLMLIVEA